MKLTLVLAAALGIATLGPAPRAHADCARSEVGFLPASGQVVPRRPTFYVFVPDLYQGSGKLIVEGFETEVERVAASPALEILRVRVLADVAGDELRVRWQQSAAGAHESDPRAHYTIGPTPPNRARVAGVSHAKSEWTCSNTDAIRFELDGNALAYRFAWRDGETTILPADLGAVRPFAGPPGQVTSTDLGKPDCMQPTTGLNALAQARDFDLYALFADGSELRVGSATAQLGEHGVRLPTELLGTEVAERHAERHAECHYEFESDPARVRSPSLWTALIAAIGGGAALLGAALLGAVLRWLRRLDREHQPRQ